MKTIDNMTNTIISNLKLVMQEKNISQKALSELCSYKGYSISQGTISNFFNGQNITLKNLLGITLALDIDINELFYAKEPNETKNESISKGYELGEWLKTDCQDKMFKGYLGSYKVYFYETRNTENNNLITGSLSFEKDLESGKCLAHMTFSILTNDNKEIKKEYWGDLIVSQNMHAFYCYLCSPEIGEICMLVFHHLYLSSASLKGAMACAITISAGANRRPTIHRMCISKNELEGETLECIKGQLLLNDDEIIIEEEKFESLLRNEEIPVAFKELLEKNSQKERCICIKENVLSDGALSKKEEIKWISYIRTLSKAKKYNKIGERTERVLSNLLDV